MTADVVVIGAGVIGLAVAWRCRSLGMRVRVLDPAPGSGASHVAAGMLAPVGEATFGEAALGALMVDSARRWPGFAAELGDDVGYRSDGTLTVAVTGDDFARAERLRAYQEGLGLATVRLRAAELRDREPGLAVRLRGGSYAADDHQVDPRRVVAALRTRIAVEPQPVTDLSELDGDCVVVAAGTVTAALTGLPIRPVKGQVLRLRPTTTVTAPLRHVVRGYVDGRQVYLVPRADGEVVVGATEEEATDRRVTAGAVHDLLRSAIALVPELAEYELAEAVAGHRPGTPDNAPIIGRLDDRVVVAAGHHRHGILLAPVTADLVAGIVAGADGPQEWTPGRFRCE